MKKNNNRISKHLPLSLIEPFRQYRNYATEEEDAILQASIERDGLESPILVHKVAADRYGIIDGHRRWRIVRNLGLGTFMRCFLLPTTISEEDVAAVRFELHNTRDLWTVSDRRRWLSRIRKRLHLRTNAMVIEALDLPPDIV